jgi:hypothetical protein
MRRLTETGPTALAACSQRLGAQRRGSTAIPGGPKRLSAARRAASIGRAFWVQAESANRGARSQQASSQRSEAAASMPEVSMRYRPSAAPTPGTGRGLVCDGGQHGQHGDEFMRSLQGEAPTGTARTLRVRSTAIPCRQSTAKF